MSEEKKQTFEEILSQFPTHTKLIFGKTEYTGEKDPDTGFDKMKTAKAVFSFRQKGFGFGEICIKTGEDGITYIDSEMMSLDKVKELLCAIVDTAIFDWEQDPKLRAMYDKAMNRNS